MDNIKVGVIGCGMVSNSYLNTLQNFAHVEFVACADLMEERAQQVAAEYGFKRACSVDELLAGDDSDLVLNLSIPAVHCEVNLAILYSGKHVYSEKPLGIKLSDSPRSPPQPLPQPLHLLRIQRPVKNIHIRPQMPLRTRLRNRNNPLLH